MRAKGIQEGAMSRGTESVVKTVAYEPRPLAGRSVGTESKNHAYTSGAGDGRFRLLRRGSWPLVA